MFYLEHKYHAVNIINKRNKERVENYTRVDYKFQRLLEIFYEHRCPELLEFLTFACYHATEEITLDMAISYFTSLEEYEYTPFKSFFDETLEEALSLTKDYRPAYKAPEDRTEFEQYLIDLKIAVPKTRFPFKASKQLRELLEESFQKDKYICMVFLNGVKKKFFKADAETFIRLKATM